MPTPGERRALLFIASVAALGVTVRGWRAVHPPDGGALAGNRSALARQIEAVDSAIAAGSSRRKPHAGRSDAAGAVPRAPSPAPRARGRQPAVVDTAPRDPRQAYWERSLRADSARLRLDEGGALPAGRRLPRTPQWTPRRLPLRPVGPPVDLDVATIDEVAAVPLIGPALARRIVSDRIEQGAFGSLVGLERVPGITPAFTRRLAPFVTFSRTPRLDGAGERRSRSKSERRPGGASRP
jgi:hypothetical protein